MRFEGAAASRQLQLSLRLSAVRIVIVVGQVRVGFPIMGRLPSAFYPGSEFSSSPFHALSSSVIVLSNTENYGVGAKIAAAPRNKAGFIYLSWKDGYMIHLWRDQHSGLYGLRQLELPDGGIGCWA